MSLKTAIYTRSQQFSGLTDLISIRFWRQKIPQENNTLPAVTYRLVSDPRVESFDGHSGLANPRLELTAWAETDTEAESVAEQLRLCFEGWSGTVSSVAIKAIGLEDEDDGYDDETEMYFHRLDLTIWHNETKPSF